MRRGAITGLALVALVAAVAAGCTSSTAGTPSPAKPSATAAATPVPAKRTLDPNHITAKDALGDFAVVDACSLVSLSDIPARYTEGGPTEVGIPISVDTCSVTLNPRSGDFVNVDWGTLESAGSVRKRGPFQERDLGHGLTALSGKGDAERCTQYLVFADDLAMSVFTDNFGGKPTGLCDAGSAILDLIVKSVREKQPAVRSMPADSLVHRDACEFLTPDIATMLPGAAGARTDRTFPSHHACHYTAPHNTNVELVFSVVADEDPPADYKQLTIAGRKTYQYQDDGMCELTGIHRQYQQSRSSHPAVEALELLVFVGGRSSVCADAVKLADKVWRKLPG